MEYVQIIIAIASAAAVGIGVYVGVKVDLAVTREIAHQAMRVAGEAHKRIDNLFSKE